MHSSSHQQTQSNQNQSIDTVQTSSNTIEEELQQVKDKLTRLEAAMKALTDNMATQSSSQGYIAGINDLRIRWRDSIVQGVMEYLDIPPFPPPPQPKKSLGDYVAGMNDLRIRWRDSIVHGVMEYLDIPPFPPPPLPKKSLGDYVNGMNDLRIRWRDSIVQGVMEYLDIPPLPLPKKKQLKDGTLDKWLGLSHA